MVFCINIYQATLKDLEGVSQLFNLYRMFYDQQSDIEGATHYISERLERQESIIFVAKEEERYIGFSQLYPTFSSISMKRAWVLNDLYVEVSARQQGVGEKLLNKAKQFAVETDAKGLSLCTAHDNYSAQKLYEKLGYVRETEYYYYDLALNK